MKKAKSEKQIYSGNAFKERKSFFFSKKTDPYDWWQFNTLAGKKLKGKVRNAEIYMSSPVCKQAEALYLLLFLHLSKEKSAQKSIKRVFLHSYDGTKTMEANAIYKKTLVDQYDFIFGEETYLIIDGPLAGTLCQLLPNGYNIPNPTSFPEVIAHRPLAFDANWIDRYLEVWTNTSADPYEKALMAEALKLIRKKTYGRLILPLIKKITKNQVDTKSFFRNIKKISVSRNMKI